MYYLKKYFLLPNLQRIRLKILPTNPNDNIKNIQNTDILPAISPKITSAGI